MKQFLQELDIKPFSSSLELDKFDYWMRNVVKSTTYTGIKNLEYHKYQRILKTLGNE